MTHKTSLLTRFAAGAGALSLLLPFGVSAATPTPQQVLDQAFKNSMQAKEATMTNGRMEIKINAVEGKKTIGTGDIVMSLNSRALAGDPTWRDSEGMLRLDRAKIDDMQGDDSFNVEEKITVEWKLVNKVMYFRVSNVPAMWSSQLPAQYQTLIGQWIRFEMPKELTEGATADPSAIFSSLFGKSTLNPSDLMDLKKLQNMSLFRVTRVEKREVKDGQQIMRLRVMLNPALISMLQNREIKQVYAMKYPAKTRNAEVASINKKYAEMRKVLNKLGMVAVVNATTKTVTRLEIGGSFSEPTKDCTYNARLKRDVCKVTGSTTVKIAAGFDMAKGSADPISVPTSSVNFMDLLNQALGGMMEPSESSSSPSGLMPTTNGTATPGMGY